MEILLLTKNVILVHHDTFCEWNFNLVAFTSKASTNISPMMYGFLFLYLKISK